MGGDNAVFHRGNGRVAGLPGHGGILRRGGGGGQRQRLAGGQAGLRAGKLDALHRRAHRQPADGGQAAARQRHGDIRPALRQCGHIAGLVHRGHRFVADGVDQPGRVGIFHGGVQAGGLAGLQRQLGRDGQGGRRLQHRHLHPGGVAEGRAGHGDGGLAGGDALHDAKLVHRGHALVGAGKVHRDAVGVGGGQGGQNVGDVGVAFDLHRRCQRKLLAPEQVHPLRQAHVVAAAPAQCQHQHGQQGRQAEMAPYVVSFCHGFYPPLCLSSVFARCSANFLVYCAIHTIPSKPGFGKWQDGDFVQGGLRHGTIAGRSVV